MAELTTLVGLRVTPEEVAVIDDLARRAGLSRARVLRAAVRLATDRPGDLAEVAAALPGRPIARRGLAGDAGGEHCLPAA